jgi:hypothetical protein
MSDDPARLDGHPRRWWRMEDSGLQTLLESGTGAWLVSVAPDCSFMIAVVALFVAVFGTLT